MWLIICRNAIDGVKGSKPADKKVGVAGALNSSVGNVAAAGANAANEQFMRYYNKELKV